MDIFNYVKDELDRIISVFYPLSNIFVDLERPKNEAFGDISTNILILLSHALNVPARDLAPAFIEKVEEITIIDEVTLAGPGFLNLKIKVKVWQDIVNLINSSPATFGEENLGKGERINVEFVSANPTGPLHIGHIRGAIMFDVIANLLTKFGFEVTREYYLNDAGSQIEKLVKSCYLRYQEAVGVDLIEEPPNYPGEYLKIIANSLYEQHGEGLLKLSDNQRFSVIRNFTITAILELIKEDLHLLNIQHDTFVSENALIVAGEIEQSIKILEQRGLIYESVLDPPKGGDKKNWKPRKQLLFKATLFGDTEDRALTKENGDWTYFASDIAYHQHKLKRGFKKLIVGLAVDHFGYVKRLKAVVNALSNGTSEIEVSTYNIVNFMEDGKAAKMSKRSGKFLSVKDVVEEIGVDALRFMMLTCRADRVLDFDFNKVKDQSKDNLVFYVQYAHARACSVLRKAKAELNIENVTIDLKHLSKKEEVFLMKALARWPWVSKIAFSTYEPYKITAYLQEVAEAFHALWNCGKREVEFKFINNSNINLSIARLALVQATANIIAIALKVLNIQPVESM